MVHNPMYAQCTDKTTELLENRKAEASGIFYAAASKPRTYRLGEPMPPSRGAAALFLKGSMARKRVIDPEFWSDEAIGRWSDKAKLFYIGLWNFADDEGRLKAHPDLLNSQIFPYDRTVDIEALKKEIGSKVVWYDVDGSQYGYVRNFLKHQRIDKPAVSKLPPHPGSIQDQSSNDHRLIPPNIIEVKRSKEKYLLLKFSHFWSIYPRKIAKQAALRAWLKLEPTDELVTEIFKALEQHKQSRQWKDDGGRYIPYPATWLNGKRWADALEPAISDAEAKKREILYGRK